MARPKEIEKSKPMTKLLVLISSDETNYINVISKEIGVDSGAITRQISRLEKENFISRTNPNQSFEKNIKKYKINYEKLSEIFLSEILLDYNYLIKFVKKRSVGADEIASAFLGSKYTKCVNYIEKQKIPSKTQIKGLYTDNDLHLLFEAAFFSFNIDDDNMSLNDIFEEIKRDGFFWLEDYSNNNILLYVLALYSMFRFDNFSSKIKNYINLKKERKI